MGVLLFKISNDNKDTPSVNSKEKALALIRKELAKKGVWHTENEVEDVLDALYEVYEADGTVPTREAFAERCANEEVTQAVLGMGRDPFLKKKLGKRGVTAICAGCVLAVALIGGGVWWAVTAQPQDSHDAGSSVTSVSEKKDADEKEKEASSDEKTDTAVHIGSFGSLACRCIMGWEGLSSDLRKLLYLRGCDWFCFERL